MKLICHGRPLLFLILLLFVRTGTSAQPGKPFRFLHVSDTHVTASKNDNFVRDLVAKAGAMSPPPAFIVNTGDVTELGFPEEFEKYKAAIAGAAMPIYNAPGNHDVRWSPLGKEAFERTLGKLYQSFDVNGCHFVVLDSTVVLEHWGHFDNTQLRWLEADLKKQKLNTPIFIFFHHWIGRENPKVDNAEALLRVLTGHNVVGIFMGHGHSDLQWKLNGIPCFMVRGLYQGSHNLIEVGETDVKVFRHRKEDESRGPALVATLSRQPQVKLVAFAWDDPDVPLLGRRRFVAELRVGKEVVKDERSSGHYSVDGGKKAVMEFDPRSPKGNRFIAQFPTKGMKTGFHTLDVEITSVDGQVYRRSEPFQVERLHGDPSALWSFSTSNTIQSSPTLVDKVLYVTSFDGKLYAIDSVTGRQLWAAATKGALFSSPVVGEGVVIVGSMDHFIYAFDARTGKLRWKVETPDPLFASAAIHNGIACIGGNRKVFGVEVKSGKLVWTQETGGFFQSRALAVDDLFVLGGWDNTLYGLDVTSGAVRWSQKMGKSNGGKGNLMFYFSPAITSPAHGEGRIFVCTNDGVLHALAANSGDELWVARAPEGGDSFGYSSPLYSDGKVYLGGLGEKGQGDCYALDAATGKLFWRCSTGADNYDSSPALAGNRIVIGSVFGKVSWIDRTTGKLDYQYALEPGYCFSTPAATETICFIPSMNSTVYAIKLPSMAPQK